LFDHDRRRRRHELTVDHAEIQVRAEPEFEAHLGAVVFPGL